MFVSTYAITNLQNFECIYFVNLIRAYRLCIWKFGGKYEVIISEPDTLVVVIHIFLFLNHFSEIGQDNEMLNVVSHLVAEFFRFRNSAH